MSLSEFFHIESSSNTNFKLWKKLTTSIGIKKNHQLLIYGEKIIKEVSQNNNINVLSVILSHNNKGDATELLNSFKNKKSVSTFLLSNELYKQLDIFNTQYPILVIKKPESRSIDTKELLNTKSPNLYLYLALSDPLNLGAVIRSATAFDARAIILLKESCSQFNPKCIRSSVGLSLTAPIYCGPSIHELPKTLDFIGLDMHGEPINKFKWPITCHLLLGEEGQGLPKEMNRNNIQIPMVDDVESLNANVAASIAMYSYFASK